MDEDKIIRRQDKQDFRFTFRRLCLYVFFIMLAATGLALRAPVMDGRVRYLVAATLIFGLCTALIYFIRLFDEYPQILYPALFLVGLGILWGVLASKPPNAAGLSQAYVKQLLSYKGEKYVWGGESHRGIDCSGLARAALWQAMLKEGVREFNPRLIGITLWKFWWRDISARDLLSKKYGYTYETGKTDQLAGYDDSWMQLGDLAVAGNGSHVLIYVGHHQWIEANPDDGKVVINKVMAGSQRPYFRTEVVFLRWWVIRDAVSSED